jgi:hypothetical protein
MTKEHFEHQIFSWLNNKEIRPLLETNRNLINIAFHHLIRWYPQISDEGFDIYSLDYIGKLRNWDISSRAILLLKERLIQSKKPYKKIELNKILKDTTHPEHNVSVDLKKAQLLNLKNPSIDDVRDCLNSDYKVILLSKEEKNVLNGKITKEYVLDGTPCFGKGMSTRGSYSERLNSIEASIVKNEKEELIKELLLQIK